METRSALENLAERVRTLESFPVPSTPPSVSTFPTFYTLHIILFYIFLSSICLSPSSFGIPKWSEKNSFQLAHVYSDLYKAIRQQVTSNIVLKYPSFNLLDDIEKTRFLFKNANSFICKKLCYFVHEALHIRETCALILFKMISVILLAIPCPTWAPVSST